MRLLSALAALLLLGGLPSEALTQTPCLTTSEAESVALVALPEIIRQTGATCTRLPATSLVRRANGPFFAKYQAEADRAWPAARGAIAKLSDPAVSLLLDSDYARPMITSIFALQIVGRIQPTDCVTIDRLVTLLEPLPARNTAGIVVATLQYLKAEKARRRTAIADVPDLPVCAVGR